MSDGGQRCRGRPRWSIAPYLIVDDVIATANYYRDKLGFGYERFWGDPPRFCMVRRNGVVIMLAQLERSGVMRPNRVVDPSTERGTRTFGSTTPTR
jgi:predicted lactoylglutathione lyase